MTPGRAAFVAAAFVALVVACWLVCRALASSPEPAETPMPRPACRDCNEYIRPAADARTALLTYAREYRTGVLDDREHEVQDLLAALRPDRSPRWRWRIFELAAAVATLIDAMPSDEGRATTRNRWLDELAPEGRT